MLMFLISVIGGLIIGLIITTILRLNDYICDFTSYLMVFSFLSFLLIGVTFKFIGINAERSYTYSDEFNIVAIEDSVGVQGNRYAISNSTSIQCLKEKDGGKEIKTFSTDDCAIYEYVGR